MFLAISRTWGLTRWAVGLIGIYGCLIGPGACAQESADVDLAALSLESLLAVRVTTASKKSERLSESPAAVFVVDSTDISRYGYRTLADALRSVVGLYTSSDRGFDYLGVRGYARFGDYNGRILLLVDGHRVNDPIFDTAPIGEECPVDMENVERIEVVKGPGSSLWGTNALLATVNVITRKGGDIAGARIAMDSEKVYSEYGSTTAGGLEFDCSVSGVSSDGENSIYYPEFDSPDTNNGIAANVDGTGATRAHLGVSYRGLKLFANRGKRTKVLPTASYGTIFNDPGTRIYDDRASFELSYERPGGEESGHSLLARVYSDQYRYIGEYVYDYPPRTVNQDHDFTKWWGAEIRRSDTLSDRLSVTCGAEYQRVGYMVQSNADVEPYWLYYAIPSTQTTRSLYAQANYAPSNVLHLTLGTRCDDYSTFGSTWSPRAAAVYSPSEKTSIKLLYGNAFRAPNHYELAWPGEGMPVTQPEKIRTQELVWEQNFGRNSRLVTSLFRFEIKDMISLVETEDSWYITNQGTARSSGFETYYETRSSYGTRGYAGLCVTSVSASNGEVPNAPNYLLSCGLSKPVLSHRYYLSQQLRSTGRLSTKAGQSIKPTAVVDLVLTNVTYGQGTSMTLGVFNLFGSNVYAPAPTELTQDRVPQVGRTLRFTVSRDF